MSSRGYAHPATKTRKVKFEIMRLCANLQARRMELGMTQEAFAEKAGISTSFLAQLESGHRTPSLPMLIHLASVLRTDVVFRTR